MRLIHIETNGPRSVMVYRESSLNEYVCRFSDATGKPGSNVGDYFTDDKQDALDTAKAMLRPTPFGWDEV